MDKKTITPIDEEVELIQIQNYIHDVDRVLKKNVKRSIKAWIIISAPFLVSIAGYLITSNLTVLFAGFGLTMTGTLIHSLIEEKVIKRPKKGNIINIDSLNGEEKDIADVLSKNNILEKKGPDFYREEIAKRMELMPKKRNNNPEINKPKLTILDNSFPSKDETMVQIVKEIDMYFAAYKLPPQQINNDDWDIYFDVCYRFFEIKGFEKVFYDSMSKIVKLSLARILVNKKREINIKDYIFDLNQLELQGFTQDEISTIKNEILSGITQAELININDLFASKKNK